jgi:hypothetical protein
MDHFFKINGSGPAATNARTFGHFGHASQTGPPDLARAFAALFTGCAPEAQPRACLVAAGQFTGHLCGERKGSGYGGAY